MSGSDIKTIFDKSLPDVEPPIVVNAPALLSRGIRRQRNRRLAAIGGGGAVAVSAVVAVALLVPALAGPGGSATGPADDGSATPTTAESNPDETLDPGDFPDYTKATTDRFAERFPDYRLVPFKLADQPQEPFALTEAEFPEEDPPYVGQASMRDADGADRGVLSVELRAPGSWTREPGVFQRADLSDETYLYSCEGNVDADEPDSTFHHTVCDQTSTDAGESVVTVTQEMGPGGGDPDDITKIAIVFRDDGTAIKTVWSCMADDEDDDTWADGCSSDLVSTDDLAAVATDLPDLPFD